MKQFNSFRRRPTFLGALAAALMITLAGCTKVDDTLGSNLIPEDQQMRVGFVSLSGQLKDGTFSPKKYFETRLYQTDSILSSNITTGHMGSMLDEQFGVRTAGFLTQYISAYVVEQGYFGYKPIFDSVQLILSMDAKNFGGDSTVAQKFCIYEIESNKYLTEKPLNDKGERDTLFFLNFDPVTSGALNADYQSRPLFRFTLGGQDQLGPATETVTLEVAGEDGRNFIKRLMLQQGEYADDYSIYGTDSLEHWVKEFKGLYIAPEGEQQTPGGAMYATQLDASGFMVYGRNRNPDDPSLIKDTIYMGYQFYNKNADHGNVSVNNIRHDWDKATTAQKIDIATAKEPAAEQPDNRPTNPQLFIEGMGGVISELTFTQEFFDELTQIIIDENQKHNKHFSTLAVTQARIAIYFEKSQYDWSDISDIPGLIDQMDSSIPRLGMYTDFKKLTGIDDYPYSFEQQYGSTLAYGGYVNRSLGCYVMDISAYTQALWNRYIKEVKAAEQENRAVDLEKVEGRKVYIAPEAYSLYSPSYGTLQGMTDQSNKAPVKIDLTYNLIK